MDLHAWITQQVDRAEAAASAELEGCYVVIEPADGSPAIGGTVTGATLTAEGPQLTIAQYSVEPRDEQPTPVQQATAALRRCEADRRILARHTLEPDYADSPLFATACRGCGTEGYCHDPATENLNDCPELLDLAHAHGLTPEILAGLDRPQPPEPKQREPHPDGLMGMLRDAFDHALTKPITTSQVPAALRGPRWKP